MENTDTTKYEAMVKRANLDMAAHYPDVSPTITSNTRQAIMYLNSHMPYIKHKYKDELACKRYDRIIAHLQNGFDKIDERPIKRILAKNLIFPGNIQLTYGIIFTIILVSMMAIFGSRLISGEWDVLCIILSIYGVLIFNAIGIPLAVAILNDSSFRLYRLKRIKNVQLDR